MADAMEISLIALDLDGTLLNSKKELSKENANVLRRAGEKGIHVCFASGRMASLMTAFEREMETNCYFLGWNGACIIDKANTLSSSSSTPTTAPSSSSSSTSLTPSIFPSFADRAFHEEELRKLSERRRMFHQPVPRTSCDRLIEFASGRDLHLNVYLSHHIFAVDLPQHRWCIELYVKRAEALFSLVKDFDELKTKIDEFGPPTKMLIVVPHERREELYLELQPLFSSELNLVKSDPEYLEFLHKDVNKGEPNY
jgi:hydroxymethylpyrimidine pyrophosphatase-like HAD family hydrolase